MKLFGREQHRFRYPAVALVRFEARQDVEKTALWRQRSRRS